MRSKNKIVSLLLCACMFLTLIPSPAAAAVGGEFVDAGSGLKFEVLTEDTDSGIGTVQVVQDSYGATDYSIPETVYQDGINYAVTGIGNSAFKDCSSLTSISIPDGVTVIGASAFSGCSGLYSVNIPDSVTGIYNFVFQGCGSLTSISIPGGVTEIGISAFSGTGLTSITIPAGLEKIWDYAFSQCANLTAVTFLGIDPPAINGHVFTGTAVQTVTVPAGAQAAYGYALSGKLPEDAVIEPAAATITGVSVSPPAAEVERGGTMTFSATVSGSGSFSQAVEWSIESTSVSDIHPTDGILTVATAEYAPTMTVRATSLADQNVYGEATVTVKSNAPQEQFSLPAGSTCYFDLSSMTVNASSAEINSALPDISLKWIPFTYAGTVDAYSLDASASGDTGASETAAANAGSRSLFLADHVVYKNITWDELNAAGLIFGNSYTANGVSYLLRSLSGGSNTSTPSSNEWDQILFKGDYIHYCDLASWVQDTFLYFAPLRIIRGYDTVDDWDFCSASYRDEDFGFRPALEVLNDDTLSPDALKTVTYDMGANGTLGSGSLTSAVVVYEGELTLPEITEAGGFHYTGAQQSGEVLGWYNGPTFCPAGTKLSSLPSGAVLTAGYGVLPQNNLPGRKDGIAETTTASVTVNTPYTLNLADIFEDADGDPLTYRVSVNGADEITADAVYSYTPASAGATTLVFRANDGTADSADTYTVTLTANNGGSSGGGSGGGGNSPQPASSSTGSATVNPSAGGSVSLGSDVTLNIPANALQGNNSVQVAVQKVDTPPPAPSGFMVMGTAYEFTVNGQDQYSFDKPVTLTFTFDPSRLAPGEIPAVHYYDEEEGRWVNLGGTVSGNTITVTVDHFTKFAVMAVEKAVQPQEQEPSARLTDIAGHWAEKNIEKMVAMGAVSGYPGGAFKPDAGITRAEFTAMLVKAFSLQGKGDKVFADTAGYWAREVIATAVSSGIIGGYDQNTFGPDDPVTREQMAVMTVKAARLSQAAGETAFADGEKISTWAREYVNTAVQAGIIKGYSDNTFRPGGKATRAEAVTIIVNALK